MIADMSAADGFRPQEKPFRIQPMPNWRENAYLDLFYGHLDGIVAASGTLPTWPPEALRTAMAQIDALHFHWPEAIWRGPNGHVTAKSLVDLTRLLTETRRMKRPIFWTVHNLKPHEGAAVGDRLGGLLLGRFADLLICHDPQTAKAARTRFYPRGEVVVMPHGNYGNAFPPPRQADVVRRELGLDPSRPVLSIIGLLRGYKGFDVALAALRDLPGLQLLIAGTPHGAFDLAALKAAAADQSDVRIVAHRLSEQELSDYHGASDLVLLPYRNITGSGALLTALTLRRAVVTSDLPFFSWMLDGHPAAGRTAAAGALAETIRAMLNVPADERAAAAGRLASRFDWDKCAASVAPALLRHLAETGDRVTRG